MIETLDTLVLIAVGLIDMTLAGGFVAWVLSWRFGWHKARLLALAFTVAVTLPIAVADTF